MDLMGLPKVSYAAWVCVLKPSAERLSSCSCVKTIDSIFFWNPRRVDGRALLWSQS
ncbi:hypothetical protein HCUR_00933 [Holospora curviuscula]|uniref:Uncharacterized protein n=1 Tax=Holospora curviuscula TaxID=1082868 RepID=A0A2S5R8F3_9PROT|nr:hypothetical protein HCUR_00933 [Holospora curviuscula]